MKQAISARYTTQTFLLTSNKNDDVLSETIMIIAAASA